MTSYIKVKWLHNDADYPVLLYSELDDFRWEIRKVEIWADGKVGYASSIGDDGKTRLGITTVPPIDVIAANNEFEPVEIPKAEFEKIWTKYGVTD